MDNEKELINAVNDIKKDVAVISFCVCIVTALIVIELILSIVS